MKTNKKNYFLGFIAIAFISFSACNKIKDAIQADVDITPTAVYFDIDEIPDEPYSEKKLSGVDNISALDLTEYKGVKSINIKSIKVKLEDGDSNSNFKSLEKVEIKIKSGSKSDAVLASFINNSTADLYEIEIPVTGGNIDLKDYLNSTFSYEVTGKAKAPTAKKVNAKLTAVYTVKFGL